MSENGVPNERVGDGVGLALGNAFVSTCVLGLIGLAAGLAGLQAGYILSGFAIAAFGAAQIPGVIYFSLRNKHAPAKLKGLLIASSILFLLNAGCWGLVITAGRR